MSSEWYNEFMPSIPPWTEGYAAYQQGKQESDNPYDPNDKDDDSFFLWAKGFEEAKNFEGAHHES